MTQKKLPHGSILHALFDAKNAGTQRSSFYQMEVNLGISGWDLRAAVEDLRSKGYLNEDEDGIFITEAGYAVARTRWV